MEAGRRPAATGKGRFIDDLEPLADIAHAAILRSTQAHARIVSLDASEAEGAPGVQGVLTGEDVRIPGDSGGDPRGGPNLGESRRFAAEG